MPWNQSCIPDLTDRVILITGATSGLGLNAARLLLAHNATVIMACRDTARMSAVAATLLCTTDTAGRLLQLELDLCEPPMLKNLPSRLAAHGISHIDILLLNAGIISDIRLPSHSGLDSVFVTNVLAHWHLTGLLLPFLLRSTSKSRLKHSSNFNSSNTYSNSNTNSNYSSANHNNPPFNSIHDVAATSGTSAARIVLVSSLAHLLAPRSGIDYDVVRGATESNSYNGREVYACSKVAAHWLALELNRRLGAAGLLQRIFAVVAHPGYAHTAMTDPATMDWSWEWLLHRIATPLRQSSLMGATSLVRAAVDPAIRFGDYVGPDGPLGLWGFPVCDARRSLLAENEIKANEMWAVCEQLTGYVYDFPAT